ncbi:glycosyltransferase family 2 protein [Pannonibacter carbonis]|uniref:glycosyltransferase family 2 protein n=1 Tax=Pannonibacter carbonis TaxID=2067569 RepID=UPI00130097A1|nr:glycosyltransferase family A protein [Pannonibacter carbonis]
MSTNGHGRVSVIIPCYNCAATITAALDSIVNQTLAAFEVLCIDDCSKDDTVAVITRYSDRLAAERPDAPRIVLHRMARNGGPSPARNAGWSMAAGDYVAFLDSDDVWHPRKLEAQMRVMLGTGCFGSSHARKVDLAPVQDLQTDARLAALQPVTMTLGSLLYRSRIITSSVILRNSPDYRFPEDMRYCEDFKLWCQILSDEQTFMLLEVPLSGIVGGHEATPGLSAAVVKMEKGKLSVFRGLYRDGRISWLQFVTAIAFSNLKFVIRRLQSLF